MGKSGKKTSAQLAFDISRRYNQGIILCLLALLAWHLDHDYRLMSTYLMAYHVLPLISFVMNGAMHKSTSSGNASLQSR